MSSYCSVFDSSSFGNCLADLTVSELLTLKHSLKHFEATKNTISLKSSDMMNSGAIRENREKPATMALVAEERGYEDGHLSYEHWQPEEKTTKLQTLFQISVTALAFLSFGGYLLCLIVQSIKSKGTTYFHNAASTMATTKGMKRIKVYRRSRRSPIKSSNSYKLYGQHYNYSYNLNNPYQYYQTNIAF